MRQCMIFCAEYPKPLYEIAECEKSDLRKDLCGKLVDAEHIDEKTQEQRVPGKDAGRQREILCAVFRTLPRFLNT